MRTRPHDFVFEGKHRIFYPFSPVVHTENLFSENAAFLVWLGEDHAEKASYTLISSSILGCLRVGDGRKRIKKYAWSVWTGEKNEEASVVENVLLRLRWEENG